MNDSFVLFDLNLPEELKNIPQEKIIESKKKLNTILKDSKSQAKLDKCYYCNNNCKSFCNSHTIPQFCLKNIAVNGKVYWMNTILEMPAMKDEKGVNESGVFHLICRDCDSKIFKDYENPENYNDVPTIKMLAQIDMKNNLKNISKRLTEIELYKLMGERLSASNDFVNYRNEINKMDLKEYEDSFSNAKKVDLKPSNSEYHIGFYQILPYVVPVAFQGAVALVSDINGDIINDIYNPDPKYVIKNISLCIFPFKTSSLIMLFVEKNNRRFSRFFRQLKKLSLEEQLSIINFILFSYTEDYFLSPNISKDVIGELSEVSGKTTNMLADAGTTKSQHLEEISNNFDYNDRYKIPNLLLEEFAINTKEDD
ncbi:hypothetical protein [Lacrimispora sp.]|uniref:hypothetical protein n=1 Tax=Lacrimispora sp. TaxID=2719234 RepID=UPI00345F85DC